jgi:hypothetical protein
MFFNVSNKLCIFGFYTSKYSYAQVNVWQYFAMFFNVSNKLCIFGFYASKYSYAQMVVWQCFSMFPTSYVFLVFPYLAMFPEISVRILKVKNPKKRQKCLFLAFFGCDVSLV